MKARLINQRSWTAFTSLKKASRSSRQRNREASSDAVSSSFIAGRCKPKGCFRRPGVAAIAIVEKQVGCLRRLGILLSVSRCPHHEVERLGHPRIARLRVGPGDNNGAEIGGSAGKLVQACDLAARAVAILRREEGRRRKLQRKGAIVTKRDIVRGAGRGLIIGVRMLPPARCNEPDLVAHVRVAEPGSEPGTCAGQPQQQQRRFYFLLLRRGGALIRLPASAELGKMTRDGGRDGIGNLSVVE